MTRDFIDPLIDAFDKDGYEYIIVYYKDLNTCAQSAVNISGLDDEYTFPTGRTITKKESLLELVSSILTED